MLISERNNDESATEIRRDIVVLGPDDAGKPLMGFVIYEYTGCEVYPLTPEIEVRGLAYALDSRNWEFNPDGSPVHHIPIKTFDGLKDGMKVIVKNIFDYLSDIGTVVKDADGGFYVDLFGNIGTLSFGEDDRECWVCTCWINKRLLETTKLVDGKLVVGEEK
jgi:hypothetical protein